MKKILLLLTLFVAVSCAGTVEKPAPLKVLISKDNGATKWINWIDSTLDITVVYNLSIDSAMVLAQGADAIIITGGADIFPQWYGKPEYEEYCEGFDKYRDSLEIALINYAIASKTPILGICRGLQLMNVANGGTMIPDIETFLKIEEAVHRNNVKLDSIHTVIPTEGSWITKNYPNNGGAYWVNTRHHQCIDQIADNFEVTARDEHGVIESIVLKDPSQFALGVQWHPEDSHDEFSKVIGKMLLTAAKEKKQSTSQKQ